MGLKTISYYVTDIGDSPFINWLEKLPLREQVIINKYIHRASEGGTRKNVKSLKDGIFEIKINHGAGLRIYFAEDGDNIILLLLGGDKSRQSTDIRKAKFYWRTYGKEK